MDRADNTAKIPAGDCADQQCSNQDYIRYIREKTNQLLEVIGTKPLQPEELDDRALIELDPIGIIAQSFKQILATLNRTIEELTETKNEIQAIFDATGVGISVIDRNFVIERHNEKQRELLIDPEMSSVIGHYCYEVYSNRCSPVCECPARESFATGKTSLMREVWKKGRCFQIITTPFSRSTEGNVEKVIEVSMDITEKKVAEAAEKELKEYCMLEKMKLATIIESLTEGLMVLDRGNRVLSWNRAAEEMTQWLMTEMKDQPLTTVFPELESVLKIGTGNVQGHDLIYHVSADEERVLSVNIGQLEGNDGESIGKVVTFSDNTERRKRNELYHRAEKLAAIGQLSAGVAHELNTPLGSVLGYARLLIKDKTLTPTQKERALIIAEQAKKSSLIIQGLLRFARQSNRSQKTLGECQLNEVIKDTRPLLETELSKRKIELVADLSPLAPIVADYNELEQVVLNLTMNAIQAIRSKGRIQIKTRQVAKHVLMTVTDDGPGIPEAIRSRIFDPFYTTKPVGEGTGLGLSICSGIVGDMGGTIDIESHEGKGTTIIVALPLVSAGKNDRKQTLEGQIAMTANRHLGEVY
jgi:two-component system NtrC family sensor kinase